MKPIANKKTEGNKTLIDRPRILQINGFPVIQSCAYEESRVGSMYVEENMMVFVLRGAINIEYGKVNYCISKHQMAFLKKDIVIEYQVNSQPESPEGIEFILFSLNYELVKEFTRLAELSPVPSGDYTPVTVNNANMAVTNYVNSLGSYFINPGKAGSYLIKIKLLELLFHLVENDKNILIQILDLKQHFRGNITLTVEENILNSLSLHQLAVLSGRSLSSFRRDFMAIYNMPPSQWIRKKRLEKAQEFLLGTTMTITDICYTLGFESIAHFSRLFKSRFGYPPSEFRQNLNVA